jgi:uncharacterized protein (DUF1501 family)
MAACDVSRRFFVAAAGGAAIFRLGGTAWAGAAADGPKRLVVILLRGAVDGLNVVIPYGDPAYYAARPTIAVGRPGTVEGALPLDRHFGLHPALVSLMPLWDDGAVAFIHAAGSPDPNRSHFEAQRYIENGTPGNSATPDGWMNRLLQVLPGPRGPTAAISIGPTLPRILSGSAPVANLPLGPAATAPTPLGPAATAPTPLDRPALAAAFDRLYAGTSALDHAYREGRDARSELTRTLAREQQVADAGAPPASSFARSALRLGRLLAGDPRIRLAFVALGGWDTHVDQGGASGWLANRLRPLGDGLVALARGLGAAWHDTAVVVLSEFGRTVHENGDRGTDHGHGNVIWLAGGAVRGGRVYGDWPGLAPAELYQRRDLAVTTDFRAALAVILERHLGLADRELAAVFPGAPAPATGLGRLLT